MEKSIFKVGAILPAAGIGTRFGERKQFKYLGNKPLFLYALDVFINCKEITEIVMVTNKDDIEYVHKEIDSFKTKKSIKDCDVVIVKFGDKYKQWNAAFDAGYATALNKSMIVIHNDDHQHALKEVDASALAVVKNNQELLNIFKYVITGKL